MTLVAAINDLKKIHEKAVKHLNDTVKNRLPELIGNMKNREDSLSIQTTISECGELLATCRANLAGSSLAGKYTHKEMLAQNQTIRDIEWTLREQEHNLFEQADRRGFAFLG